MKIATVRLVVILGALSIAGILFVQAYWFSKTWSAAETEFDQTVRIALLNVAKSMAEYNNSILPSSGLIKRVSSNYYVVNFNNVIDANLLEYYLLEEFGNLGLNVNFEYAIYDCADDEMVYGNFCNVEEPEFSPDTEKNLPRYDEFIYYFGVQFPTRSAYVLQDLRFAIIFSAITLIALLFFTYAIIVILKQRRLSELQRDFINNMTHEFKTPISSIKVSSEVLSKSEEVRNDQRLSRYAEIIRDQNNRLNDHVEKVLSIAKVDDSEFELHKEKVNLHEVIREVVKTKALGLDDHNGSLNLQLDAEHPEITADRFHLSNVLFNLLDNAIKYSGDHPEVTVGTTGVNGSIAIFVRDKGPGIAPEHQKQLFEKFFRVPTGNVHNVKGFGLGLHYVKRIVDKHGWKIQVNSELGKGTEMQIII